MMDTVSDADEDPSVTNDDANQDDLSEPTSDLSEGESRAEEAYRRLEEMIVTLALSPGATLTESRLGDLLGLGRTPIREALQRLSREHMIVIMPRRGIRVTEVNVEEQLLLLEARRELERLIATRSARRATAAERRRFASMASTMERAAEEGDYLTFLRIDRAFNRLIAECARNPFADAAIAPLHSLSRRFWFIHYKTAANLPQAAKMHADIMRGVAAGDEAQAAAATDRWLDYVEEFTRSTIDTRR
jgi:DNA-binding GntR family transcriptional regulator